MSFFDYLKNAFFILIILQIAPSLIQSIRKQYGRYVMPRTKVALVELKGVLYNSNHYNKHLNKYFKDSSIKGILLKMECPGAASGTAQSVFNEISSLKKKYPAKPVITLVENICASGGYYIACAGDAIVAPASALIGSIGVNLPYLFQLQDLIEYHKIKYAKVSAGKYKNAADPFINMTPDDKMMLQHIVDDSYEKFMQDVAATRKVSLNEKQNWAEGKIFTGRQALKLGLIDAVGSAHNAIDLLRDKAMIKEQEELEWVRPAKRSGFWSLFGTQRDEDESASMFSRVTQQIYAAFENNWLPKATG